MKLFREEEPDWDALCKEAKLIAEEQPEAVKRGKDSLSLDKDCWTTY